MKQILIPVLVFLMVFGPVSLPVSHAVGHGDYPAREFTTATYSIYRCRYIRIVTLRLSRRHPLMTMGWRRGSKIILESRRLERQQRECPTGVSVARGRPRRLGPTSRSNPPTRLQPLPFISIMFRSLSRESKLGFLDSPS